MITTRTALARRPGLAWLVFGLFVGMVLAMTVAGPLDLSASRHVTGIETVVLDPVEADYEAGSRRSGTEVWIYGSGFTPGTEVIVAVADGDGVLTEITAPQASRRDGGGTVFPLIANAEGAWATNWRIGRFIRIGGDEAIRTLWVFDSSFNVLAATPIALCDLSNREEGDEVPSFCSG